MGLGPGQELVADLEGQDWMVELVDLEDQVARQDRKAELVPTVDSLKEVAVQPVILDVREAVELLEDPELQEGPEPQEGLVLQEDPARVVLQEGLVLVDLLDDPALVELLDDLEQEG